jgi:uncharacterized protein GlcG (DUF336 family)
VSVTLAQARAIADGTLAAGRERDLDPLTVAVLDTGGHVVVLQREDGSGILRPQIATGKAWGALGMGFGTRELAARAERMPSFVAALSAVSEGRVVPVPGGVLIRDPTGTLLGAVGVSGDLSDADESAAVTGIESAGLTADTGA